MYTYLSCTVHSYTSDYHRVYIYYNILVITARPYNKNTTTHATQLGPVRFIIYEKLHTLHLRANRSMHPSSAHEHDDSGVNYGMPIFAAISVNGPNRFFTRTDVHGDNS